MVCVALGVTLTEFRSDRTGLPPLGVFMASALRISDYFSFFKTSGATLMGFPTSL